MTRHPGSYAPCLGPLCTSSPLAVIRQGVSDQG